MRSSAQCLDKNDRFRHDMTVLPPLHDGMTICQSGRYPSISLVWPMICHGRSLEDITCTKWHAIKSPQNRPMGLGSTLPSVLYSFRRSWPCRSTRYLFSFPLFGSSTYPSRLPTLLLTNLSACTAPFTNGSAQPRGRFYIGYVPPRMVRSN